MTNEGTIVPGIKRHFVRINPVDPNQPQADEDPIDGTVLVKNRPPGTQAEFPASKWSTADSSSWSAMGSANPTIH